MEIPNKFNINRKQYSVVKTSTIPGVPHVRGLIHYEWAQINLATHAGRMPRERTAIAEAFWHEVTHAILYDMQSSKCYDEIFVDAFSKRLNQVVHSAKF